MTTNKLKVSLFSKVNLRIVAIILSCMLVQSVAVASVLGANPEPIANQYGSARSAAYPVVELQWKPVKPVAGEDVTFSILFRDAASGTAKSHVDYTFTISKEGKVVYTTSKHTHSGTDTINQKLNAGMHSITVTITDIDFNKVEPKSSDFSINVEKTAAQEQPTPVAPKMLHDTALAISTLKDSYSQNEIVSAKVMIQGGKRGDTAVAKIISPDGKVVSSVNIAIAEEKFEAGVSIGSVPSGASAGTWKVTLEYAGKVASNTFKVTEVKPEVATKPVPSLQIKSDKDTYSTGETARTKGAIKDLFPPGNNKIMIVITGPDGKVYLRNELETARDGSFEVNFDIKRDYPTGTWNVEAVVINEPSVRNSISFKVIESAPSVTPVKPGTETSKSGSIILLDSAGQKTTTVKTTKSNSSDRVAIHLFLKVERFSPSTDMTVLVLDPDENVYLQEDITTDKDGSFSLPFTLENTAKEGTWSIQVATGDSIEELTFEVVKEISGIESQTEVSAVVKNLKKMTMIAIKNTGTGDIGKISIKVKQGSIQFVKVISKQFKDWERKRVADNEVIIRNGSVGGDVQLKAKGGTDNTLFKSGDSVIVIIKWNDRPDIARGMKVKSGEDNPFLLISGNDQGPAGLAVSDEGAPSDKPKDKPKK